MLYGQIKLSNFDDILKTVDENPHLSQALRSGLIGGVSGGMWGMRQPKDKFKNVLIGTGAGLGAGGLLGAGLQEAKDMYNRHELGEAIEEATKTRAKDLLRNSNISFSPKH